MEPTHFNERGEANMVDISTKEQSLRTATVEGFVRTTAEVIERIRSATAQKGDVLGVAKIAGISAAKKTAELIPLCHPIALQHISISFRLLVDKVEIVTKVRCFERTGAEMEAITATAIAAVTIYDMCKAIDKSMVIEGIRLLEKTGGKSGTYRRY